MLKKFGFEANLASNGLEAINELKANKYDLVLMDIQMPVMDGIEATKIIRSMESSENKDIPIIAMTAYASTEAKKLCLECGMNYYLAKPINVENFIKL